MLCSHNTGLCQAGATDELSGVGGRRGTVGSLFPSAPPRTVRAAFAAHGSPVGGQSGRSAIGITPPSLPSCRPPVALRPVAGFPDRPGGASRPRLLRQLRGRRLAPRRPSRLPSIVDVRARRRCPVRPLQWAHCPPPTRRRVRASAVSARYPGGPCSGYLAYPPTFISDHSTTVPEYVRR
jgi:hypothetical protein